MFKPSLQSQKLLPYSNRNNLEKKFSMKGIAVTQKYLFSFCFRIVFAFGCLYHMLMTLRVDMWRVFLPLDSNDFNTTFLYRTLLNSDSNRLSPNTAFFKQRMKIKSHIWKAWLLNSILVLLIVPSPKPVFLVKMKIPLSLWSLNIMKNEVVYDHFYAFTSRIFHLFSKLKVSSAVIAK